MFLWKSDVSFLFRSIWGKGLSKPPYSGLLKKIEQTAARFPLNLILLLRKGLIFVKSTLNDDLATIQAENGILETLKGIKRQFV